MPRRRSVASTSFNAHGGPPPLSSGEIRLQRDRLAAEPDGAKQARLAELIVRRLSFTDSVTASDLESGGFTRPEIAAHFQPALALAAAWRFGDTL